MKTRRTNPTRGWSEQDRRNYLDKLAWDFTPDWMKAKILTQVPEVARAEAGTLLEAIRGAVAMAKKDPAR